MHRAPYPSLVTLDISTLAGTADSLAGNPPAVASPYCAAPFSVVAAPRSLWRQRPTGPQRSNAPQQRPLTLNSRSA